MIFFQVLVIHLDIWWEMEDCVEGGLIIKLQAPLERVPFQMKTNGLFEINDFVIFVWKYDIYQNNQKLRKIEMYFSYFSDQRTRAQNQAGSKVTDMAVCCDICNTKFGFLTRKVIYLFPFSWRKTTYFN